MEVLEVFGVRLNLQWTKLAFEIVSGLGATIAALAAGIWAVHTWRDSREKDRQQRVDLDEKERRAREAAERGRLERESALYGLPFLAACQDLQSRIYNILAQNALPVLREQYPEATYAEETTYLIVQYFGWAKAIRRYGPYAFDRIVMGLTDSIGNVFATDASEFPTASFRFFRPQQRALGEMVMVRAQGQFGIEFETMPFYEFRERLGEWRNHGDGGGDSEASALALPMADIRALRDALTALRDARSAAGLPGRERLAAVQRLLVNLLDYLEERHDVSVGDRPRNKVPG